MVKGQYIYSILAALLLLVLQPPPAQALKSARGTSAMVASADTFASAAALEIMKRGGNAVDAAIATAFALAVTYPQAGNIGGGGFMLIRLADGESAFIDYRETAPAAATRDMYLDSKGEVIDSLSLAGHRASGVPGTVAGLALAHRLYGTVPWAELIEPARRLARDGFPVTQAFIDTRDEESAKLRLSRTTWRIFGRRFEAGDTLKQPELARTLERIMQSGEDEFYRGETARRIAGEMSAAGGLITLDDLENYRVVLREPLHFSFRGYDLLGAPLPSSGGLIVSMLLSMIEPFDIRSFGFQSTEAIHLASEAEKIVYLLRARFMGDEDFYPVPWRQMMSPGYIDRLRALIDPAAVLPVAVLDTMALDPRIATSVTPNAGASRGEHEETTHFSIVDPAGNAVANTYTLNGSFGSGVTVTGAGFLMNNEMDDFSIKPGYPNLYGLVGGEANAIEPGKRMLSSMSPTIVCRGETLFLVLGTPGGSKIPTTVFQVITNIIDFGMGLEEAVRAPRTHEQYLPDRIYVEKGTLPASVRTALERLGHTVYERSPMCDVHAIIVEGDSLTGVSDPRGTGCALGY